MSKRRPAPERVKPTYEADDRMLTLLGELQEARNDLAHALPPYLSALKNWTNLVKTMTEGSLDLVDALFARYDLGEMTTAQMDVVVRRTEQDIDTRSAWTTLDHTAEHFYRARVKFLTRQAAVMGYMQYVEQLQIHQRDGENVPDLLLGHMIDAQEQPGAPFNLDTEARR